MKLFLNTTTTLLFSFILAHHSLASAVYDAASNGNQIRQIAHMVEQLNNLREQLAQGRRLFEQAQREYDAFTGERPFGSIHYNSSLYQALPADWKQLHEAGGELVSTIQDIIAQERLQGSIDEMTTQIDDRERHSLAAHMAASSKAYAVAERRIGQLEQLMRQIHKTVDPKGIQDLQARISVEQALIQNETARLQAVSQLQYTEQQLITAQKEQVSRRILNPKNTGMPKIR